MTPDSRNITRAFPGAGDSGLIVLQQAPDCTEPYSGPFRQATVFVVGYGTEHEKLFTRGDRTKAIKYAKDAKASLDPVPAGALCAAVMAELLGA